MRYEHEGHKKIEGTIIVKEVRGNFGKEKWDKAEIKGRKILECICLCHLHCMYSCCKNYM